MNLKISGINIDEGLDRVGNDNEIYQQILEVFYNNESDCLDKLLTFIDINDREQSLHLLHSIKGSAGNIGANDLSTAAQRLEQALKNQTTELDPLIIDFRNQYKIVFKALGAHLKQGQQESIINTGSSITEADNIIDYLPPIIKALEEYDTNALALLAEIAPLINNQLENTFKKIRQSVEDFEFDQALVMMQDLHELISTDSK